MALFAGLASLAGLSLFFSWWLRRSSALMPLLSAACAMVFFTVVGAVGAAFEIPRVLVGAGWAWMALCVASVVFLLATQRKKLAGLISAGWLFFVIGSAAFIVLFTLTKPMLTQWDEFTFWGTAAKATAQSGTLYTVAGSNLIARSYPPGLIVFSTMMQFFMPGGYSEPTFIASFAILSLACLATPLAVWDAKHRTAAIVMGAALFLLPFLFSVNAGGGQMQWAYLVCMADTPMALFFSGTLCFYFAGGEKGARLTLPFALLLAALVCIKDMGLALALIALFVVVCDMAICEGRKVGFGRLRGWKAVAVAAVCGLALIAGAYLLWAWHMEVGTGDDRFNLGSGGQSLGPVEMVASGVAMLFGVGRTEQFSEVLGLMGRALFRVPVSLLGSGAMVLAVILAVSALAWGFSATRRQRRRVLVFTAAMALCFAAFYIFNIFTYGIIFKPAEALALKDYQRYISPFWLAWLMGALLLLARCAQSHHATFRRLRAARGATALVCVLLVSAVLLRGNWQGNFLRISPSYYGARQSVRTVVDAGLAEGMQPQDEVYILSQGDDGTRFYMFGYEMRANRTLVFDGVLMDVSGQLIPDEAGKPQFVGNVASTLIAHGTEYPPLYGRECDTADLGVYLRQMSCTHLLIDVLDEYIVEEFGPLFSDGLAGWNPADPSASGHRYYAIEWDSNTSYRFVPATLGTEGGAGQ